MGSYDTPTMHVFLKKNLCFSQTRLERPRRNFEVVCFKCKIKGQFARNCPRIVEKSERKGSHQEKSGNWNRASEGSQLHSIWSLNKKTGDFIKLKLRKMINFSY